MISTKCFYTRYKANNNTFYSLNVPPELFGYKLQEFVSKKDKTLYIYKLRGMGLKTSVFSFSLRILENEIL